MLYHVKNKLTRETLTTDVNKVATRNAYMSSTGFDFLRKYPNGKWVTGYVVESAKPTEQEKLLLEEKKELEKVLMKSLNESDPDNEFLLTFRIPKYNSDGTLPVFDSDNPLELFTIRAALANGSIAPNRESVGQGAYSKTLFYFESKEKEVSKKRVLNQLRNKAGAIIEKYANVREWLICMSYKLSIGTKPHFENDTYYNLISERLESLKSEESLNEFIVALNSPISTIENSFVVKQAINEKILKYNVADAEYMFEGVKVGGSIEKSQAFFSAEQGEELFLKLKAKVYKLYNVD